MGLAQRVEVKIDFGPRQERLAPVIDFAKARAKLRPPVPLGDNLSIDGAQSKIYERFATRAQNIANFEAKRNENRQDLAQSEYYLGERLIGKELFVDGKDIFRNSCRYKDPAKIARSRARALLRACKSGQLEGSIFEEDPVISSFVQVTLDQEETLRATRDDLRLEHQRYRREKKRFNPWLDYFHNQGEIEGNVQLIKSQLKRVEMVEEADYKTIIALGYTATKDLDKESARAYSRMASQKETLLEKLELAEAEAAAKRPLTLVAQRKGYDPLVYYLIAAAKANLIEAVRKSMQEKGRVNCIAILKDFQRTQSNLQAEEVSQERRHDFALKAKELVGSVSRWVLNIVPF